LPGTLFYEKVKNDLKEKANWTDSDELALMFRNTYQPAFYKQLHRYVHKTYRMHIAIENIKQILRKPVAIHGLNVQKAASSGLLCTGHLSSLNKNYHCLKEIHQHE
jgi:cell fate (sporulation/competence/biofilm development) regulator YmcA (YheA/YmcA/DUF963 family)